MSSAPYIGLPAPVPMTDIEQAFLQEEPPTLFPPNQDSNWGLHRKIFSDQLMNVQNQQQLLFNEKWPNTSTEFLAYHEFMMGIPTNPPYTTLERQILVNIQWMRGPWSWTLRAAVINFFIQLVLDLGAAPTFGTLGIPIDSGIVLYSGAYGNPENYYTVEEDSAFHYTVYIASSVTVDTVGLTRELTRVTPAGITFSLTTYGGLIKTGGAKPHAKLGGTKVVTFAKTGGGKAHAKLGGAESLVGGGVFTLMIGGGLTMSATVKESHAITLSLSGSTTLSATLTEQGGGAGIFLLLGGS